MTLGLRIAARPEALVADLIAWLDVPPDDPFDQDLIVVPNVGLREWLSGELVARLGILSHVDFVFPAELQRRALALPDSDEDPWRPERMAWHVLALLADHVDLGDTPWQNDPVRPWSVARRIADVLEHAATQRPDLVEGWRDAASASGGGRGESAGGWQARTWRELRRRIAQPAGAEVLLDELRAGTSAASRLPRRVVLFGTSAFSAPSIALLAHVARTHDLLVLTTSASPAAVASAVAAVAVSMPGSGSSADIAFVAPSRGDAPRATAPLLATWGRPALESARLVAPLATSAAASDGAVIHETDADLSSSRQLTRLQTAIARDEPHGAPLRLDPKLLGTGEDAMGDGSIQIHACHGLVRQLEVLRDALLHALEEDPTLSPRDIVVLCADLDAVAPLVGPVLGADLGGTRLPVLVTDRAASTAPAVHAAFDAALALGASRAERDDVLTFLAMPPVAAALGLDSDDLSLLEASADTLDVRWGVDAAHRTRWGYPPNVSIGTWREALDRLLAGLLLHPDAGVVAGIAPAGSVATRDLVRVGRLGAALGAVAQLVDMAAAPRRMQDWAAPLGAIVDLLLTPASVIDATDRTFLAQAAEVRAAVEGSCEDAKVADVDLALDIREVRAALADRLSRGGARARLRTGHVSVASLTPLRGVPFRVVAVVGVDDRLLAGPGPDEDDVLASDPRIGERDRAAEPRAALLDAVLAARERLVITCDGQDVRTGDELPLPLVVTELLDALPAANGAPLIVRHPRHLADRRNLTVGDGALARTDTTRPWTFLPASRAVLEELEARARKDEHGRLASGALREATHDGGWRLAELAIPQVGLLELGIADLVAALRDPARAFLRHRYGVHLPSSLNPSPRQVELWQDSSLDRWELGDDLLRHLVAGLPVEAWLQDRPAFGGIPPGRLGGHLLRTVVDGVVDVAEEAALHLGRSSVPIELDVVVPARAGRSAAQRVRIVGDVEHVEGTIIDLSFARPDGRQNVAALVTLLVASSAGYDDVAAARIVRRAKDGERGVDVQTFLAPVDAAVALRALTDLVDLVLRIRSGPVALLPRAAWSLDGGSANDVEKALERDIRDPSAELVLGRLTREDLALQATGRSEEGLPEAAYPALRWARALRHTLVEATPWLP